MQKPQIIEHAIVGGMLTLFNTPTAAQKTSLFSVAGQPVVNYDPANLNRVNISMGGATRIFQCIKRVEIDSETGFKAMAWVEFDTGGKPKPDVSGKYNVIVSFPGFVGGALGLEETADERSVNTIIERGEANPQMGAVPGFVKDVVDALKAHKIDASAAVFNIGGHSMGSSNAIYANHLFHEHGFNSHAILIEPYAASLAVESLSKRMGIPKERLTENIISIRSLPFTPTAKAMIPGSTNNNLMVGESYTLDMETPPGAIPIDDEPQRHHRISSIVRRLLNNPEMLQRSEVGVLRTGPDDQIRM